MVWSLFAVLFLAEAGLAVFTLIRQKSGKEWIRNRFVTNVLELLLYTAMTLLPGIDFSFRFKGLAGLAIVRILLSGVRFLIKYKKATGVINCKRLLNQIEYKTATA